MTERSQAGPAGRMTSAPLAYFFGNNPFWREIFGQIHADYGGGLDIFTKGKTGVFTGSSTFAYFAVDERARSLSGGELNAARPEDFEFLLASGGIPETRGTYTDLGVVMDFSTDNHVLALHLYEMLKREDQYLDRLPAVLTGLVARVRDIGEPSLALEVSSKYPYKMRTAKILKENGGAFRSDDLNLILEGIPLKLRAGELRKGERRLNTALQSEPSIDNLGLSGFYVSISPEGTSGYDINANEGSLSYSHQGGRILLVRRLPSL